MMDTHRRVERYAERFFQQTDCTEFPTVRAVARALRIKQSEVEAAVEGDPNSNLMLTSYFTFPKTPLGGHYVEVINPPASEGE